MNLHFQPVLEDINKIEAYLHELELVILNAMGSQKFKWNDFKDIKRKSSIADSAQKVKVLIENSQEVREAVRQLNREYLRLKLAIKNLGEFTREIEGKAQEIEMKLIGESFIREPVKESSLKDADHLDDELVEVKDQLAEITNYSLEFVEHFSAPKAEQMSHARHAEATQAEGNVLSMFHTKETETTVKATAMNPMPGDNRNLKFEYRIV